jgi:hypothetical protein
MAILTDMYHLQKSARYAEEKPYTMRYVPESEIPASNVVRERHQVSVSDMREIRETLSLDRNGFQIERLATPLPYEDFDSHEHIVGSYLSQLEDTLTRLFPESTVDFVSYLVRKSANLISNYCSDRLQIRKRESSFPYSTGRQYTFGQPNIVAHIDATADDLIRQMERRHGSNADMLFKQRAQYITIWKPLRGPLHDYPLALCDNSSVDFENDVEPQDIVDRHEVLENVHIYHRPHHRWYYLSGQEDSELLVFRQADTASRKRGKSTAHPATT